MARSAIIQAAFTSLLLFGIALALQVSSHSPCEGKCLSVREDPSKYAASGTYYFDLACYDSEFTGSVLTEKGQKLAECQNCLLSSGWAGSGTRDIGWFLVNNKDMLDWCLFGRFGNDLNNEVNKTYSYQQCNSDCNPISEAIDYRLMDDPIWYSFCDAKGNFSINAQKCIDCLYVNNNMTVLGNVLAVVSQMCLDGPFKIWREFVDEKSIYTPTRLNLASIISASSSASPTFSSTSTLTSSPTSSPTSSSPSDSSPGLSNGVIASIVLSSLILTIAILVGTLLYFRRLKKQQKAVGAWDKNGEGQSGESKAGSPVRQVPGSQGKDWVAYQYKTGYSHAGENAGRGHSPAELANDRPAQEVAGSRASRLWGGW
ncbi:hypothetical protein P154DRAFT_625037 [Amniculicola lignicola CBS 123094]|uniref:LPXTG-domain-containing protein n=1 Tax=Amniculicola lignicola CBS 123094 TaxID=1392246 RepID=A0A6A5W8K1_9PLEO|nr:hypothetical protein P154DRAFT_625037 [Amniculicola lignicola CBS 123094]